MGLSGWHSAQDVGSGDGGTALSSMLPAVAEVGPSGAVRALNDAGRSVWGWQEGTRLPNALRIGLSELEEGAVTEVLIAPGGPTVLAVRFETAGGWLLIGPPASIGVSGPGSGFQSLIENLPVSVSLIGRDGTVSFANAASTELTGYDRVDIEGRRFWIDAVHPEDRWELIGAQRRALEGRPTSVTIRFMSKRRGPRLAELHFHGSGSPAAGVACTAFDVTERSEVEEALFQSEALYRVFLEQSPVGMLHLDAAGTITFENHQLRQIIGEGVDDAWIGRKIKEIDSLDGASRESIGRMLEDGESFEALAAHFKRPGVGTRNLLLHGSSIRHPEGGIVGGVLMVEDRTEERQQKEELDLRSRFGAAEAELRKAALLDNGRQPFLNAAAHLLGEAAAADRVHILVNNAAGDCASDRSRWWRAGAGEPESLVVMHGQEAVLRRIVEERRPVHLHARDDREESALLMGMTGAREAIWHPFFDETRLGGFVILERTDLSTDGAPVSWSETERRLIEQLVRLFETLWSWMLAGRRYRRITGTIDDCLFTFTFDEDGERRYLFLTPQIRDLTGYAPEEIVASDGDAVVWSDQIVHESDQMVVAHHDDALRGGGESRVTYRVRHVDGSIRWLQEHGTPEVDAMGDVIVSGILTDVTEQKAAEEVLTDAKQQAESANRLKSAFIATMSHEIRTPMGAVNGFAELLTRELADLEDEGVVLPPQVIEFLQAIRENSKKLLTLVNDLFDLSNLEVGSVELRKSTVYLNEIVMRSTSKVAMPLSRKGVDLKVDLADDAPVVVGDPQRLEQVMDNLLSNALKFTDEGEVVVRTRLDDGWVLVEVQDTGVGMSDQHLDRLFEPFVQEDSRLNRQFEGSGLGLSLAKRLLDLMGGEIDAESTKGEGSLFRIRMAAARAEGRPRLVRYRSE